VFAYGKATMLGLVIEDQPDTRVWLVDGLQTAFPAMQVDSVASLESAGAWLGALGPAHAGLRVILVDLVLPDGNGISIIRRARDEFPEALCVVATAYDDDARLLDAMAAGAEGYLLKQHDKDTLVRCLRRIDDGEPPQFQSSAGARPPARGISSGEALTPREVEVLALLGRGARVAEVAACLGLSEQTVSTYVKIIYRKLRISSRAEAALEAVRRGLV
jgi:DNA-binding NarL/FixJ family response regulator